MSGTTRLYNAGNPSGASVADAWVLHGANIGSYAPGSNAIVTFSVRLAGEVPSQGVRSTEILAHAVTGDGEVFAALRLRTA